MCVYSAEILLTGSWPLWTVGQARGILTKKMEQYIVWKSICQCTIMSRCFSRGQHIHTLCRCSCF